MSRRSDIPIIALSAARGPAPADLLDLPLLGRLLRWRHARAALQLPMLLLALVMIWDGFTGSQLAPKNLATVLTWVQYRGLLLLALLAFGNLFCMACPFMLPRNLARRMIQPARSWPRRLRNKWLAIGLLGLFLFGYELFDLWSTPLWTAWLIVGYFTAALAVDSLFSGASFCKYVCPLGQFNFVGSLVSPFEVAVRQPQTCADCHTKDCIAGNVNQRGCELWLFQPRKIGNMDCTFCLDCIHACPHDNVGIIARVPGAELLSDTRRSGIGRFAQRPDIAALIVLITFGALLNAFGMVSPIYALEAWLAHMLGVRAEAPVLSIIFVIGLLVEPALLLGAAAWLSRRAAPRRAPLIQEATRYAYALAPLGIGIWAAHYGFHFLTGFWTFVPALQHLFADYGWPILGQPRWELGPLLPAQWLAPIETGLIGLGWIGSLLIAREVAGSAAGRRWALAWLPWAALATLLAFAALWIMGLPMEMRGTVFGS